MSVEPATGWIEELYTSGTWRTGNENLGGLALTPAHRLAAARLQKTRTELLGWRRKAPSSNLLTLGWRRDQEGVAPAPGSRPAAEPLAYWQPVGTQLRVSAITALPFVAPGASAEPGAACVVPCTMPTTASGLLVFVAHEEHHLLPFLRGLEHFVFRAQLSHGDVAIVHQGRVLCLVERKERQGDLLNSIQSNHLAEQRHALATVGLPSACLRWLVEGAARGLAPGRAPALVARQLQDEQVRASSVHHMAVREGFSCVQTANLLDTANWVLDRARALVRKGPGPALLLVRGAAGGGEGTAAARVTPPSLLAVPSAFQVAKGVVVPPRCFLATVASASRFNSFYRGLGLLTAWTSTREFVAAMEALPTHAARVRAVAQLPFYSEKAMHKLAAANSTRDAATGSPAAKGPPGGSKQVPKKKTQKPSLIGRRAAESLLSSLGFQDEE